MHYIKPNKRLLRVWQLRTVLSAAVPAFLTSLFFTPFSGTWRMLTILWVLLYALVVALYLPMLYLSTSYRIDARTVEINRGVFYLTSKTVLLRNVEYVTLESAPDERLVGLSSISLFVVGGRVLLSGLTADDARVLTAYLPGGERPETQAPAQPEPDPPEQADGLLPSEEGEQP